MSRKIDPGKKREAIRLRLDEQLSTPEIARRLKISNFVVYRFLKNHPWAPRWPVMKGGKRATWSRDEVEIIKRMYPTADECDLLAALPGRPWTSISKKASALNLRRPQPGTRKNKRFVHPIFSQLRHAREQRKWTRPTLADAVGSHYNQILYWELGQAEPHFLSVVAWAETLGFEIVLKPKLQAVSEIAAPDRRRLMGGR